MGSDFGCVGVCDCLAWYSGTDVGTVAECGVDVLVCE